jgi:hypothetical protein
VNEANIEFTSRPTDHGHASQEYTYITNILLNAIFEREHLSGLSERGRLRLELGRRGGPVVGRYDVVGGGRGGGEK